MTETHRACANAQVIIDRVHSAGKPLPKALVTQRNALNARLTRAALRHRAAADAFDAALSAECEALKLAAADLTAAVSQTAFFSDALATAAAVTAAHTANATATATAAPMLSAAPTGTVSAAAAKNAKS